MDKNASGAYTNKTNSKLKEAREKLGLTQAELAVLVEIEDPTTISRWERGVVRPSPKRRLALAKVLNMSVDELGLGNSTQQQMPQSQLPVEGIPVGTPFYKMHTPSTSFVGRAGEIARVCTLLKWPDVRLITLLGAGGIGKTRLGIQVAAQVCEHFSDGVCFVGLDSIRDQGLVVATIAKELGIHESGKRQLLELVKRFLHAKNFLLLLDSFEHVITAAPVLDQILHACPQMKVLVTSRSILHLQLEHIFTVYPLQPKNAELRELEALKHCAPVELFAQRARILQPDFALTFRLN